MVIHRHHSGVPDREGQPPEPGHPPREVEIADRPPALLAIEALTIIARAQKSTKSDKRVSINLKQPCRVSVRESRHIFRVVTLRMIPTDVIHNVRAQQKLFIFMLLYDP